MKTNSTSERSFSAMRRVKSYLRSTMTQERMNNLMILNVHKELTVKLILLTSQRSSLAEMKAERKFLVTVTNSSDFVLLKL